MTFLTSSTAQPPPTVSGYAIAEQLYLGARTAVYRAMQTAQQRPVVIKVLQRAHPSVGELMQFRNQYLITKDLLIPGVVRSLSLEPIGHSCALVMEDFGGLSLAQYVQQQSLTVIEVVAIAIQLADILHDLSLHRIIHKDIKPANILIHPESKRIQLIDFSIASLIPRETHEIRSPNVLEGTLAYLAPEQTGRMNRGIDYRADFYSLGVTLYQLLTERLPFVSKDPLELMHCHMAKAPDPIVQTNAEVPAVVAAIVAKLMAKNAEDRYQSALGLKQDLEQCLAEWKATGNIPEFELGACDVSDRFLIPEKLYGRAAEVQTLLTAFERVAQGASELVLVAGFSGIGKTAVVNEVHKPIIRQRGYFIKGKFDQFNRNIPLSSFVQAFRNLIRQLLSESDARLMKWKALILDAVSENGQVLIDVIPELEQIIGKQAIAPALSGNAAGNRFKLLFKKFVEIFTTVDHPLVLFLDDLQWADLASLELIKLLMNDNGYLLILGAYRDNEVSLAHPFMLMVKDLQKAEAMVHTITLRPLAFSDTNQLIADTLNCSIEQAQPLSELIDRKTAGSPFFTTQFLKTLYKEKLSTFDVDARHWLCNIAGVQNVALTNDVVDFMALQLQKLPEATQAVLKLAACIGAQFDLETLAIISEQSQAEVAAALWEALQEGLILPQSESYRFHLEDADALPLANSKALNSETLNSEALNYKFLHDRVQQAAYSLILEEHKQLTHLTIGRLLLQTIDKTQQDGRIFEIVNQLNSGIALITSSAERQQYAQLNWQAGRKAKESTAYDSALHYFNQAIQLFVANPKESTGNRDQIYRLYEDAAEAALLNSDFQQMETLIEAVLQRTDSLLEQVKVYEIKLQAYQVQNQQVQAIAVGRNILQKLGINLPESATSLEIQQEVEQTLAALSDHKIATLADLPQMQDENALAAVKIMTSLVPSIHQAAPQLFPLVVCKKVRLSLQYGNSPLSAPGYADFGIVVSAVLNKLSEGYEFGQLALRTLSQFSEKSVESMVQFKVAAFNQSNQRNIREAIALLKESYKVGLETGDSLHTLASTSFRLMYTYLSGAETLTSLLEEIEVYQVTFAHSQHFLTWAQIIQHAIKKFTQVSKNPTCLGPNVEETNQPLAIIQKNHDALALHLFYLSELILSYAFGDISAAVQNADEGKQYLSAGLGMPSAPIFHYYDSLTRLARYSTVSSLQQAPLLLQVDKNQEFLGLYAEAAPMNYQHQYDLIEAERFYALGNKLEAIERYDLAIAGATENEFIVDQSLANELAAKFYLSWGKDKIAQDYLIKAYYGYVQWGAKAKVQALERLYPNLLAPILQQQRLSLSGLETMFTIEPSAASQTTKTQASSLGATSVSASVDLATVLKASQALSSEIDLDRLLAILLQTVLENAGANKAVLLIPHDHHWFVEAVAILDQPVRIESMAIADSAEFPHSLVNGVRRSCQPVVIADASVHPTLAIDRYVMQQQSKSLLCTPIINQGKLVAVLYVENCVTIGAFTSDRVELLNVLCTQAAISLENARLYRQVNQALKDLQYKEAQSRGIFEAAVDGLLITDLETGEIIDANPAYCQMHGYSYSDILQLNPLDFIPLDRHDKFLSFLTTVKAGQKFTCEAACKRPDGTPFLIEISSVPFWYNGNRCGLSVIRDLTERKQMELSIKEKNHSLEQTMGDLQQAQMQMVQSEKMSALGNLVAGIAHEINNPIGFLKGSIKNAKDYVQDLQGHLKLYQQYYPNPVEPIQEHTEDIDLDFICEDLPKLLTSMTGATNRIQSISTSLRTFSRADTEHKVNANLIEGLDSTLLILKYRLKADENRPEIKVLKEYGKLPLIDCFPGRLNQVFMNLLANAIDVFDEAAQQSTFAELQDRPQLITIKTVALDNDNRVEIRIRDNGKGMPEAVKARIFDNLFTTKAVGKGTGLGLAIARQIIVEAHGGSIDVCSKSGEGTEFCIQLPISD